MRTCKIDPGLTITHIGDRSNALVEPALGQFQLLLGSRQLCLGDLDPFAAGQHPEIGLRDPQDHVLLGQIVLRLSLLNRHLGLIVGIQVLHTDQRLRQLQRPIPGMNIATDSRCITELILRMGHVIVPLAFTVGSNPAIACGYFSFAAFNVYRATSNVGSLRNANR